MSWKYPRDDKALHSQWLRRALKSMPFILQEVATRMAQRVQVLKPVQGSVLYQGWLHSGLLPSLQVTFEGRQLVCVAPSQFHNIIQPSMSHSMFAKLTQRWACLLHNRGSDVEIQWINPECLVGSEQNLGITRDEIAVIWSPLWLQSVSSPLEMIKNWHAVLKPEGCLFFSSFGPDTAKVLKRVSATLGVQFPDYLDMHDLGDLLVLAGFSNPVMEMEKITLTYRNAETLIQEWRDVMGNCLQHRESGLKGRGFYANLLHQLSGQSDRKQGLISLELEVVYGHAWKVRSFGNAKEFAIPIASIGRKSI